MQYLVILVVLALLLGRALRKSSAQAGNPSRKEADGSSSLRSEIKAAEALRDQFRAKHAKELAEVELFSRNFKSELDGLYAQKKDAHSKIALLKESIDDLYGEVEVVRSKLDAWYKSSDSIFGYRKTKIKEDSFWGAIGFSQTLAQRDNLKERRNSLYREIDDAKSEKIALQEELLKPAVEGITTVKADRERFFHYRKQGLNKKKLKLRADETLARLKDQEREVARLRHESAQRCED